MEKSILSVREVAEFIGVHHETVYSLVQLKQIPHFRFGSRILFSKEAIEQWIDDEIRKNMNA